MIGGHSVEQRVGVRLGDVAETALEVLAVEANHVVVLDARQHHDLFGQRAELVHLLAVLVKHVLLRHELLDRSRRLAVYQPAVFLNYTSEKNVVQV